MTPRLTVGLLALSSVACGGSSTPGQQVESGTCGAGTPATGCNTIADVGPTITPTCEPGPLPTGAGGTIVDGTYVLTGATYYGGTCLTTPTSGTLAIAGGCWQEVSDSGQSHFSQSFTETVSGNELMGTSVCYPSGSGAGLPAPAVTFTAEGSTLTLFSTESPAAGVAPVFFSAVFTRQ